MIIQTGMRTDIPAFYSSWFVNRIKEGYVLVRNPYNPMQVTRYEISPDIVDLICFCTKNPRPMLSKLDYLKNFGMFWYVTITCYEKDMEPNVPDKKEVISDFRMLSERVGRNSIGWRYDPIIVDEKYTVERHMEEFEEIASALCGCTSICVISFVDLYSKVKKKAPDIREVSKSDQIILGRSMINIAEKYGMVVRPCGEDDFLKAYGADCSGCMTKDIYEKAIGTKLQIPKSRVLREECACTMGVDIGAYNSCMHLCRYCYANYDNETVKRNFLSHDKNSPFLLGQSIVDEKICIGDKKSWVNRQLSLDNFMT